MPTDTDGDGIPDDWERQHGLNPEVADQNMVNAQGYTALEVYLNSLMGEQQSSEFHVNAIHSLQAAPLVAYDRTTATLRVSQNAVGAVLKVYNTAGRLLSSRQITSALTSLSDVKAPVFLVRIEGSKVAPRVIKVVK